GKGQPVQHADARIHPPLRALRDRFALRDRDVQRHTRRLRKAVWLDRAPVRCMTGPNPSLYNALPTDYASKLSPKTSDAAKRAGNQPGHGFRQDRNYREVPEQQQRRWVDTRSGRAPYRAHQLFDRALPRPQEGSPRSPWPSQNGG